MVGMRELLTTCSLLEFERKSSTKTQVGMGVTIPRGVLNTRHSKITDGYHREAPERTDDFPSISGAVLMVAQVVPCTSLSNSIYIHCHHIDKCLMTEKRYCKTQPQYFVTLTIKG